jgi:hypothetical protein
VDKEKDSQHNSHPGNCWCWKCGGKVQRNVSHTWHRIDGHECGRIAGQGGNSASDTVRRFFFFFFFFFFFLALSPVASRNHDTNPQNTQQHQPPTNPIYLPQKHSTITQKNTQVRFMHYLQQYRSQRQLDAAEAEARGAEREELEDIALVNKARKASFCLLLFFLKGGRRGRSID